MQSARKKVKSYSVAIVRAVHKAFKIHHQRLQGEQDNSHVVPAATATRVRALCAIPTLQHSIMAASASSSQVLTLAERQSRVAAFKAAMSDPDRRADAQAGLTEPAWIQDVLRAVVEPARRMTTWAFSSASSLTSNGWFFARVTPTQLGLNWSRNGARSLV